MVLPKGPHLHAEGKMRLANLEARLRWMRAHGADDDTEVVVEVFDEDALLREVKFAGGGAAEPYIVITHGPRLDDDLIPTDDDVLSRDEANMALAMRQGLA